jgi:hypothetical protein
MYDGPKLKDSEISTVLYTSPPNIIIDKVNGKSIEETLVAIGKVQLKPGEHTFRVKYHFSYGVKAMHWLELDIVAVTEANHNYIFRTIKNQNGVWSVYLVDKGKDFPADCFSQRLWANDHSKFYSMGCDLPDKQVIKHAIFPHYKVPTSSNIK